MYQIRLLLLIGLLLITPLFSALAHQLPQIQLSNIYRPDIDVTNYFISEKLDGVRAYWDGKNLISREGNIYNAPIWFTENFPPQHLEGELWVARGKFEVASSIVRKEIPDQNWQQISLMLFDMPQHGGVFSQRYLAMKDLVEKSNSKYLKVINQEKFIDQKTLMKQLREVVKNGGEGLVLHRADSFYQAARNDDLLKLKTYEDAEAVVISYIAGKGKYSAMLGAVLVENEEGVQFKIGGGFSDEQRKSPPKIGSVITYKFFGKTKNNKPRFASFMRVREEYNFKRKK